MIFSSPSRPPTTEECEANAEVMDGETRLYAAWYPQMGGYRAACWLLPHTCEMEAGRDNDDGFDAFVYHDGDFPFLDRSPAWLHHCAPSQFIQFGQLVRRIQSADTAQNAPAGVKSDI